MKYLFLLIAISTLAISQTQKKQVLIERQSSASCPNCRTAHQNFQPFIEEKDEETVVLAYQHHSSFYFDPMGQFSLADVNTRMKGFYGNGSFPTAFINGGSRVHLNSTLNHDFVEEMSDVRIDLVSGTNDNMVEINVNLTNENGFGAIQDPNTRLFVAIKEKTVEFETSAGSNGEKLFHDVLRYFVGSADGVMLNWDENGTSSVDMSQEIDVSTVDINDLYAVAFLQNVQTREVFQAQEVMVDMTANVDSQNESNFLVFPNPARSEFQIENLNIGEAFTIYNSYGEMILTENYNGNISFENYPSGNYFIKTNNKVLKLIKE